MTGPTPLLRCDRDRLWSSLMAMAAIGATEKGGCNRIAFSALDDQARSLFVDWCAAAGLTVGRDAFGNMFARRAGRRDLPPVVMGSHLDTQPTGGKFDGVLGVLGALEVVRVLDAAGIVTERPLVIANWTNEEGAIIRPMMGSEVFTGALPLHAALAMAGGPGCVVADLLAAMRNGPGTMPLGFPMHAYLELHIEQGPVLEDAGVPIGIVTSGIAFRRYALRFTGQEAHAGPTPMALRRDPMVTAARTILFADREARRIEGARATIGFLSASPGSANTIPATIDMTLDLRHADDGVLDSLEQAILHAVQADCEAASIAVAWTSVAKSPAVPFDAAIIATVDAAAAKLGLNKLRLASGAGHDACNIARHHPTAMIFVPSQGGLSHNEAEYTSAEDCGAGVDVLLNAVLSLGGVHPANGSA